MNRLNRRGFLHQGVAIGLGAGAFVQPQQCLAANDKIQIACIGVRSRGNTLMHVFADEAGCEITHICDVREILREVRGNDIKRSTGKTPKLVNDYRLLLDNPSIDVFVIATPDHWNAILTIEACLAGKDVYVETPFSHNIIEGKAARDVAWKKQRIVQVGTQFRSAPYLTEAVEYLRSGSIGQVVFGRSWQTSRQSEVTLPPTTRQPKDLDYDMWQGPCVLRPYHATIVDGAWPYFAEYGSGDLGIDGIHVIDLCRYAMGLTTLPSAVSASGGKLTFGNSAQEWPDTLIVTFDFPGKVMQHEMRTRPNPYLHGSSEGVAIYGENGCVLITRDNWKVFDQADKLLVGSGSAARSISELAHVRNFLDAVRSRDRQTLNQEIASAHISTSMCHAANVAWQTGKKLNIDPNLESFNDPAANRLLGRKYREGFELPKTT